MKNSPGNFDPAHSTRFEKANIIIKSFDNLLGKKDIISAKMHGECIKYAAISRKLIDACLMLGDSESSPHVAELLEVNRIANYISTLNVQLFLNKLGVDSLKKRNSENSNTDE